MVPVTPICGLDDLRVSSGEGAFRFRSQIWSDFKGACIDFCFKLTSVEPPTVLFSLLTKQSFGTKIDNNRIGAASLTGSKFNDNPRTRKPASLHIARVKGKAESDQASRFAVP